MVELTSYIYCASRAEISRKAAKAANDPCSRIAHEKLAKAYETQRAAAAGDTANDDTPSPVFPQFPLRSIPKWTPVKP